MHESIPIPKSITKGKQSLITTCSYDQRKEIFLPISTQIPDVAMVTNKLRALFYIELACGHKRIDSLKLHLALQDTRCIYM